ncbi:hypothetical protein ACF0H5_009540 [Mactra antiquata]
MGLGMHKWYVFISAYMINFLIVGLVYSIGDIFIELMDTFNATRAETAVIQSTALGVGPGSGILASFLIPKLGLMKSGMVFSTLVSSGIMSCYLATSVWHMIVSFGIVCGLGFTNLYICSVTALCQNFQGKRRLFMLAVQSTGVGVGGMVHPYLLSYLSQVYGFRGALLILGALCANIIPACLLWSGSNFDQKKTIKPSQVNPDFRVVQYELEYSVQVTQAGDNICIQRCENGTKNKGTSVYYISKYPMLEERNNTKLVTVHDRRCSVISVHNQREQLKNYTFRENLKAILKNFEFVVFWIGTVITAGTLNNVFIFIADIFADKNLKPGDSTLGLFLLNVTNVIGRLLPGLMVLTNRVPVLFHPFVASLISIGGMSGLLLARTRWTALLFCAMIGTPFGMLLTMISVVSMSLVGINRVSTASGLTFSTLGILNATLGPIWGYIRDTDGSYDVPFYFTVGVIGCGTTMFTFALVKMRLQFYKTLQRKQPTFYLTSL